MRRKYDALLKATLPKMLIIGRLVLVCTFLSGFGIVGNATILWHNTNVLTIMNFNTQACTNGTNWHWDNSHWRSFTPSNFGHTGTFTITGVRMGVEVADANGAATTQPITVRIYTNSGGAFPAGTRTQIASLATTVADGNLYFQDIAIAPPAQPATTEIVVEIQSPSGSVGAQNYFRVGSNNLGQTAPSYRSSTTGGCGSSTPTDMASTGAPFTHLLIGLVGLGPTAANASVSGRVLTADGHGIRNARVLISLPNGEVRTVVTGSFGYFSFDEIEVGQTVVLSVISKRYRFDSRVVNVNESIRDLDFIALP